MKSKKTLLILILVFAALLGGAGILYSRFSPGLASGQLVSQNASGSSDGSGSADADTSSGSSGSADTDASSGSSGSADTDSSSGDSGEDGTPAPDFTVYDRDGNAVRLSDYIGKPVILNFWASWCGPCKMEMPDFQDKYQDLGGEIQFLMINMTDGSRETTDSASAFIAEQGYTFPVFYDTGSEAAIAYGAYSLPTTYFIDAEGNVIARASGTIDGETLQKGIDMICSSPETSPET